MIVFKKLDNRIYKKNLTSFVFNFLIDLEKKYAK